jgi:type IV pilus secretin PilQ/predicted competence protein
MRTRRVAGLFLLLSVMGYGPPVPATASAPVELTDVTVERQAQGASVLVKTSAPPRYNVELLSAPVRLVIDMDASYALSRARWTATPEPIQEIRGSQFKPGTARLVVELQRQVPYRVEEAAGGLRVLLEAGTAGNRPAVASATETPAKPVDAVATATPVKADGKAPVVPPPPAIAPARAEPASAAPKLAPTPAKVERSPAPPASRPLPPLGMTAVKQPEVAVVPVASASVQVAQAQTPPRSPASPSGEKLISLDFKDADIINLLRILSAESGRNIVAGEDVKGKASVSLRNVTWEQALDTILEVRGLQKTEKGGVIRVVSSEQLAKEREAVARAEDAKRKSEIEVRTKLAEAQLKEAELASKRLAAEAAAEEARLRGPLKEEVVRLLYADPEEVAKTLQGILGIPPEGSQPVATPPAFGAPLIAEPPFSALYGVAPSQQQIRPPIPVSADVLAKGLTIRAHKPTNTLFLRLYASDLERTKKLIREQLDVPLPQVKIEARMEILDRRALEAFGVQWGGAVAGKVGDTALVGSGFPNNPTALSGIGTTVTPSNPNLQIGTPFGGLLPVNPLTGLPFIDGTTGGPIGGGNLVNLPFKALPAAATAIPAAGLAFGIIGTDFSIHVALEALAEQGKTRTLARPEIVTVENAKATVSLGEEIPYATVSSAGTQIQFKEAVLKLDVTPTVIRERVGAADITKIKMAVLVENNSRGDAVNLGSGGTPPAINKRKAETLVTIKEGERLVIGGVTNNVTQNNLRKVPFLGDIPYLGWLFKQREVFEQGRELVVFVTPSVLSNVGQVSASSSR